MKKIRKQVYYHLALFVICFLAFSCEKEVVYVYDRTDFDAGYRPHSQPKYYTPQYTPYNQPRSKDYRNPYQAPPRNYSPYYDSDQYYVPPTQFITKESQEGFYPKY